MKALLSSLAILVSLPAFAASSAAEQNQKALSILLANITTAEVESPQSKNLSELLAKALAPQVRGTVSVSHDCLGNSYEGTDDCTLTIKDESTTTEIIYSTLRDKSNNPQSLLGKVTILTK